jgi:hypothetical protein
MTAPPTVKVFLELGACALGKVLCLLISDVTDISLLVH